MFEEITFNYMKKTLTLVVSLVMGICFTACSHSSNNEDDMILIDLEENVQENILFSSFVDSISYIPLETKDECLIGKIRDVIISDSIIFVLKGELNEVLLFDRAGRYLRKISHQGSGPGEYTLIGQIYYNEKRRTLSVASFKIIEYDLYGNCVNEFQSPFYVSDLYQFDNGDYLLSRLERLDEPNSVLLLTDRKGSIKKEILKRNPKYNIETTNYWELFSWGDDIHFVSPQVENIVYSYKNDTLSRELNFKVIPEVSPSFYNAKPGVPLLGDNYYRSIFRESSKWVNMIFCTTEKIRTVLYNKECGQIMIGEIFKNDMDDMEHLFFLSESGENTFTNYVKSKNEEDNPIIQILHLK